MGTVDLKYKMLQPYLLEGKKVVPKFIQKVTQYSQAYFHDNILVLAKQQENRLSEIHVPSNKSSYREKWICCPMPHLAILQLKWLQESQLNIIS
jgi:hypothetical protein